MGWLGDAWNSATKFVGLGGTPQAKAQTPDEAKYQWGGSAGNREAIQSRLVAGQADAQSRRAPTLDWSQADGARVQQQGLAAAYQGTIDGTRTSLAQQQLQAGQAQAVQQAASLAASARGGGGNAILAQREAQRQASLGQLAVNRDAGMLRTQEVNQAMQGQGQLLGQMRSGDQSQQGLISQNELSQRGMNDARSNALLSAELGSYNAQLGADTGMDQSRTALAQAAELANLQQEQADREWRRKMLGSAISGGSSAAAGGAVKKGD